MRNIVAKNALNDCRLELIKIFKLINQYGSFNTATCFLTKYALVKVSGTLEVCYKTIIADYYDSFTPELQRFISKQVREASCNATYDNIIKTLTLFDESKGKQLKAIVKEFDPHNTATISLSDLNKARNNVAHGLPTTMSFIDIQRNFYKSLFILQRLDSVLSYDLPK